jgi:hypothetical protein
MARVVRTWKEVVMAGPNLPQHLHEKLMKSAKLSLGKAHAHCYTVICHQLESTIFFNIVSQTAQLSEKNS